MRLRCLSTCKYTHTSYNHSSLSLWWSSSLSYRTNKKSQTVNTTRYAYLQNDRHWKIIALRDISSSSFFCFACLSIHLIQTFFCVCLRKIFRSHFYLDIWIHWFSCKIKLIIGRFHERNSLHDLSEETIEDV